MAPASPLPSLYLVPFTESLSWCVANDSPKRPREIRLLPAPSFWHRMYRSFCLLLEHVPPSSWLPHCHPPTTVITTVSERSRDCFQEPSLPYLREAVTGWLAAYWWGALITSLFSSAAIHILPFALLPPALTCPVLQTPAHRVIFQKCNSAPIWSKQNPAELHSFRKIY